MNKKVFTSMLVLCVAFLLGIYVLKIFFPQAFVMAFTNADYIAFGKYVDTHKWIYHIITLITSFITYWFYLCAVCRKKYLSIKEIAITLTAIIIVKLVYLFIPNFGMHITICCMIGLPFLFKANIREVFIVYGVHGLAQILSLAIRDMPLRVDVSNFAVALAMTIECYLWLVLFYIIYNYKVKEE